MRVSGQSRQLRVLSFLFSATLMGCVPSSSEQQALEPLGCPANNTPAPTVADGCSYQRFHQPCGQTTGSVDLLFVTHTTDSFLSVRAEVADGIDYFVQNLPAGVDYRVGVLLAHNPNSAWSGKLYTPAGMNIPTVQNSATMTLSQIRTNLHTILTNTVMDNTNGGEEGLVSVSRALDPDMLAYNQGLGFFRPNAALTIVFMGNEGDTCGLPSTDPGTDDDWATEHQYALQNCIGITPTSVYQKIHTFRAGAPTLIGAAIYTNLHQGPVNGIEAEYGWGYAQIVELAGGPTIDLASTDYTPGMQHIGDLLTQSLSLNSSFDLTATSVNPNSVQVHVDGAPVDFAYYHVTNEVDITSLGQANSAIDVLYCPASGGGTPPFCAGALCGSQ